MEVQVKFVMGESATSKEVGEAFEILRTVESAVAETGAKVNFAIYRRGQ